MNKKKIKSIFIYGLQWLPDRLYTQLMYLFYFRRWPNLRHPQLYTEKLQALKLSRVHPLVVQCADKATLRDYLASIGRQQQLTEVLDIAESFDEIRWHDYLMPYIVKISNASGHNVIVRSQEDITKASDQMRKWSKVDFSKRYRERYYKYSMKRFVVEPYIENLRDIRVHCFHGQPTFIAYSFVEIKDNPKVMIDFNSNIETYPFTRGNTLNEVPPIRDELAELYEVTKKLSQPFTYVRIDTYRINGVIKIGEMTFTPLAGFALKDAIDVDKRWGEFMGKCSNMVK